MSMVALLRRVSQAELDALLADPDLLDDLLDADDPHAEDQVPGVLDLDKAWHGIHFLLTGDSDGGTPPLDFLVRGGSALGETDENRAFLPADVATIATALAPLTRETLTARYLPERMTELDIYPTVWDRPEERDQNREWLLDEWAGLKDFLTAAAAANEGVLLSLG